MLWRAQRAESRAIVGFLHAAQDETADANLRFLRVDFPHIEEALRIMLMKFVPQLVAAFRNRTNPAPLPVPTSKTLLTKS
jgi:hypothetical protein